MAESKKLSTKKRADKAGVAKARPKSSSVKPKPPARKHLKKTPSKAKTPVKPKAARTSTKTKKPTKRTAPNKTVQPTAKATRRTQARRPKPAARKRSRTSAPSFKLFLLSVAIAAGVGVLCGQVWAKGYSSLLLERSTKQASEAPGRITMPGPAQNDPLFSMYPTWSQNYAANLSGQLNPKYWNIFKGAPPNQNQEAQYYTDSQSNLHIKDGTLSLVATKHDELGGYKYASARIDTKDKLAFLYGRIDITAKLPNGVGTWPAAWFLPATTKYQDLSPSSDPYRHLNGGEMDLIEEVGFNPNIEYGVVHTRSDLKNPDGVGAYNQLEIPGNEVNYNLYSLLWTPTSITFAVNDRPFFTYTKQAGADYNTWAFDQPFYLILNLAMGGKWGGEDTLHFPGNGIDDSALPASMDIKSIYYYPYKG